MQTQVTCKSTLVRNKIVVMRIGLYHSTSYTVVFVSLNETFEGMANYWSKICLLLECCPQNTSNATERLANINRSRAKTRKKGPYLRGTLSLVQAKQHTGASLDAVEYRRALHQVDCQAAYLSSDDTMQGNISSPKKNQRYKRMF